MILRFGRFSRDVATTLVSQVLSLALGLGNTALLVRVLGPSGKGMLDLALLVPPVLGLLLSSGIRVANVYFAGTKRLTPSQLVSNSMAFTLLGTAAGALVTAVLFLTGAMPRLIPGVPPGVILLGLLALPCSLAFAFLGGLILGMNRITTLNLLSAALSAAGLVLTVLFVLILRLGLTGAILASIGGSIVGLALVMIVLRRDGVDFRPRWDREVVRATLGFGMRGHVGNILQFMNYRLDTFLVNAFVGTAAVGIYGIATRLAELLWYLPNAVSMVILPKATSTKAEVMDSFTPRVFGLTLALTAAGGLFLVVTGRPIIRFFFSPAFVGAYKPLLALLPGVVLLGGGKVLTNELAGRGYPQYNSINSGMALVLTVVLDLLLIPKHGIFGAAVASSVAYSASFFLAIAFQVYVRRRVKGAPSASGKEEGAPARP